MLKGKLISVDREFKEWCQKMAGSEGIALAEEITGSFVKAFLNSKPGTRFEFRRCGIHFIFSEEEKQIMIFQIKELVVDPRYFEFFGRLLEEIVEKNLGIEISKLEDFAFEELMEE